MPPIDTVIVPNVVTPNGDGVNDGFRIQGAMSYSSNRYLKIMNRFGKVVYENTAYDNAMPWKGEDNRGNRLADGVYFYILRLDDNPNSA
ncbi:MAG TPA: hypothetical protein DCE13_01275, partial [Cryomorphaceae bacterium]|nr:hypothetical protein [Cryomorphaceae bacterium]